MGIMPRMLTGKYGKLSPIMPVGRKGVHLMWLFLCDCGHTKAIRSDYVEAGKSKSCGCFYRRGQHRRAEIQKALPPIGDASLCEICHKSAKLDIDHDHRCCPQKKMCVKCVRGRLCRECNKALGLFKDSIFVLECAIEYLRRFNGIDQ